MEYLIKIHILASLVLENLACSVETKLVTLFQLAVVLVELLDCVVC
jgi:hypothetical protein